MRYELTIKTGPISDRLAPEIERRFECEVVQEAGPAGDYSLIMATSWGAPTLTDAIEDVSRRLTWLGVTVLALGPCSKWETA